MTRMTADDVLAFWFRGDNGAFREQWFKKDAAFDAAIRERFGLAVEAARDGALDSWAATADGALALVILLDQFPRNIHRGSHLAFAGDAHARHIARAAIAAGMEAGLTRVQRCFLYLPFEHSEEAEDQDLSVRLFATVADDPQMPTVLDYAERHREVIRRFGRFPHRNAALGRESTAEETTWLAQPGSGF
jgi:uncharacterized protein (DUF924 family)